MPSLINLPTLFCFQHKSSIITTHIYMPSLQVRQRRAARAGQTNDIEGSLYNSDQPQQDQNESQKLNPILAFLDKYPSFLLVFLVILGALVMRMIKSVV